MSNLNYLSEQATRKKLIKQQLAQAGWGLTETKPIEEFLTVIADSSTESIGYVDYVLLSSLGKPLAIIEAKRTSRDALAGKRQAADYADAILKSTGFDSFIFLTNGQDILFWDRAKYPPRPISGFYSRDDLERLAHQRKHGASLAVTLPDHAIAGRYYQLEAIRRLTEGIEQAQRRFLLVMATGTGKTRTIISFLDILMRAKQAQRILFLADRRELVKQAINDIKEYLPNRSVSRVESGSINEGAKIHVATYPSMMQVFQQLSVGYYDVIIADESHRSIYNRYKAIFDRFDALQIGLTATPTVYIDHNTFDLFGCTDGIPTFNYGFQEAVDENHLVPYRVLQSQTTFQLSGIKGEALPEAFQQLLVAQGYSLEEIDFEGTDIEKKVINTPTNLALVREFMQKCRKDTQGKPHKSIIFATSHAHAKRLYEAFNQLFPQEQQRGLAEIIDSHMEKAEQSLDDFKTKDYPRIAISVDMLDTGIDVPAIQNLMFAKPVFSRVKFWQMIGRGTRKYIYPLTQEQKKDFLIIDCWQNFERFQLDPQGEIPNPTEPLAVKLFRLQVQKLSLLRQQSQDTQSVIKQLQATLKRLPKDNINIRPHCEELLTLQTQWSETVDLEHLTQTIAPLMLHDWSMPLVELQFRTQVERYTVAWLAHDRKGMEQEQTKICDSIQRLAESIREVQAVAEQRTWVLSQGFWEHISLERLQILQDTFAPLMKYRQSLAGGQVIELNLPDQIEKRHWIIYGPTGEGAFVDSYREKVEAHVRQLASESLALLKLRRGEDPNQGDLAELAETLNQADYFITEDILRQTYQQPAASLLDFMKHILALDKLASREDNITQAFDEFVQKHGTLTASQLNFLRGVRSAVLRHATINRQQLTRPPLSRVGNVDNLFSPEQIDELILFANQLSSTAA